MIETIQGVILMSDKEKNPESLWEKLTLTHSAEGGSTPNLPRPRPAKPVPMKSPKPDNNNSGRNED